MDSCWTSDQSRCSACTYDHKDTRQARVARLRRGGDVHSSRKRPVARKTQWRDRSASSAHKRVDGDSSLRCVHATLRSHFRSNSRTVAAQSIGCRRGGPLREPSTLACGTRSSDASLALRTSGTRAVGDIAHCCACPSHAVCKTPCRTRLQCDHCPCSAHMVPWDTWRASETPLHRQNIQVALVRARSAVALVSAGLLLLLLWQRRPWRQETRMVVCQWKDRLIVSGVLSREKVQF